MAELNNIISFTPTGDPFVDAGAEALRYWLSKNPSDSIIKAIETVAKIYVNKWDAKINSLFLNSRITHTSRKGQEKISATIKLYQDMIERPEEPGAGNCRICGEPSRLFNVGREQFCLAGSAAYVNFHHAHEDGLPICFSCAVKLFCLILLFLLEAI